MNALGDKLQDLFPDYDSVVTGRGITALYLALRAVHEQKGGGEVVVPATACPSLALAIHYAGFTPVFCDVEPDTLCLSPRSFEAVVTEHTRAVVVVYLFGKTLDVAGILTRARQAGIAVIEDLAQAFGSVIGDRLAGSFGDFTVLSFSDVKVVSGDGGALLYRDPSRRDTLLSEAGALPRAAPEEERREAALGFRNFSHGCFDALRASGMQRALNCFPENAHVFRRQFIFRDGAPAHAWMPRTLAAIVSMESRRANTHEKLLEYRRHLPESVRVVEFHRNEVCWRLPVILPSHSAQLRVLSTLRESGYLVSNHYFPASMLFGVDGLDTAQMIGLRAVNLWVDEKVAKASIARACALLARAVAES